MVREERVAQCREEFEQIQNESAAGQLLHRMATVLSVAENTNFAAADSHNAIGELVDSIGRVQQGMVAQCEDLPYLYFARSFAVVMEEAVRQLHELQEITTTPDSPHSAHSLELSDRLESMRIGESPTPTDSSFCSEIVSKPQSGQVAAPAAPAAAPLVGHEAWRRALQRQNPNKMFDFSPEAIEGRITIYRVARSVREEEVRALLHPFGPIIDFFFGKASRKSDAYALVKLESNRAAYEAVAKLNGRVLGGLKIVVNRAEYLRRHPDERPRPQPTRHLAVALPLPLPVLKPQQQEQQQAAAPAVITSIPDPPPEAAAKTSAAAAAVMEETVRQLQTTTTVPPDSPHSARSLVLPDRLEGMRIGESPTPTESSFCGELLRNPATASAAAPAAPAGVERRKVMQRRRGNKILDSSPEAIEGRITIHRVAPAIREEEVRAILLPYGPLIEFYLVHSSGKASYALVKLESNRAADEAVARLHGRRLGGLEIIVRRAEYWSRYADEPRPQPTRRCTDTQPQPLPVPKPQPQQEQQQAAEPAVIPIIEESFLADWSSIPQMKLAAPIVIPFIPDPPPKTAKKKKKMAAAAACAAENMT